MEYLYAVTGLGIKWKGEQAMNFRAILDSATMGHPERLRPMIFWTITEYFFRGAPYGIVLFIIWELFKPLENPELTFDVNSIIMATGALLICLIILYFVSRKAYFAAYEDGYDICTEGRKDITNHLRKLPMGFYNSRDPGDIGAYIVTDYANIENMVTHLVPQFFGAVTMPLVLICGLFFFNWKLALIAALVIPFALPFSRLTKWLMKKIGTKHLKVKVTAASRMIEYIQGIKLIKAFNLGGTKFERLEKSFRDLKDLSIRVEAVPGPIIILSSAILNSGMVLIILVGFSMLLNLEVSLPVYVMFLVLGVHIYQPLMHSLMFMGEMNYMQLGVERVEQLRNTPLLSEGEGNERFEDYNIEFRNAIFSYNNTHVIDGLNITIPAKKLTALVGPSGSGKTTITRLIARFWDLDSGEIMIGGKSIKSYQVDSLLSNIAIVFQDVYLFNDTIYNNIRIGKENATMDEIVAAAKAAQCHDFIEAMTNKYDTVIGEGGSTLSGGEKQRISIARAILKNAPIILLDEATASLDPENELHIQQAINDLIQNKTVVVIAHRLNTIRQADNIIVLDKGHVVEQGKHENLLSQKGLYYSMWEEQQRVKGWKF